MPKLKGRTDMDDSVLAQCVEMQSVPFNKLNLAARDAYGKIHRPQQARYMFQNLPNLSQSQKQMLLLDYAERSIKSKPLDIKPEVYGAFSLDTKSSRPQVTQDMYNNLLQQFGQSQLNVSQKQAALQESQKLLKVQQYTTTFLQLTQQKQQQTLINFYDALDDLGQQELSRRFSAKDRDELISKTKPSNLNKSTLTMALMNFVGNIMNDDQLSINLDDYFSDSSLTSLDTQSETSSSSYTPQGTATDDDTSMF